MTYAKKAIPKALKTAVWLTYVGKKFETKCHVSWCKTLITPFSFETGHNVPESKGGMTTVSNLRPICGQCNKSMGNRYTIDEFSRIYKRPGGGVGVGGGFLSKIGLGNCFKSKNPVYPESPPQGPSSASAIIGSPRPGASSTQSSSQHVHHTRHSHSHSGENNVDMHNHNRRGAQTQSAESRVGHGPHKHKKQQQVVPTADPCDSDEFHSI